MRPEQWAERHDGLIPTAIARRAGLSQDQVDHRRKSGRYRKVFRGVSAVTGSPPTWRQAVRAVSLAAGQEVWLSHLTAGRVLGAQLFDDGVIHVISDLGHPVDIPGVRSHRSGTLEPGDTTTRDGMQCTSTLRTVLDLSATLTVKALGELVDHFLRTKQLQLEDLRERVGRTRPAPGHSVKALRMVLAQRIPGYDPGESPLEARIARIIDRAGLPRPKQQHRVQYDGLRYRIDFSWPDRKLYLEGNSFGFHRLSSDLDKDAARQNELVLDGWTPIELTWKMSDATIERTLRRFLARV